MLTLDGCSSSCGAAPYGEITTTQDGANTVEVSVQLFGTNTLHDTNDSQHHALVFDLPGISSVTIAGLTHTPDLTADGVQVAGSNSASPFGDFDYVINFPHERKPPSISAFSFLVEATNLTPASFGFTLQKSGQKVAFATDIIGNGNTGNVGALVPTGVPEPATWAMMLIGFGGMGAAMRNTRRKQARAIAA